MSIDNRRAVEDALAAESAGKRHGQAEIIGSLPAEIITDRQKSSERLASKAAEIIGSLRSQPAAVSRRNNQNGVGSSSTSSRSSSSASSDPRVQASARFQACPAAERERFLRDFPSDMQKQMLGEQLYPTVGRLCNLVCPNNYPIWIPNKITGMILEDMDNQELLALIDSEIQLRQMVEETMRVLGIESGGGGNNFVPPPGLRSPELTSDFARILGPSADASRDGDNICRYFKRVDLGPNNALTAGCRRGERCVYWHCDPTPEETLIYREFMRQPEAFLERQKITAKTVVIFNDYESHAPLCYQRKGTEVRVDNLPSSPDRNLPSSDQVARPKSR